MSQSTTEIRIVPLAPSQDVLTDLLRDGARRLLAQAIEAEVASWIDDHSHLVDDQGRRQVVRNGHLPERSIQTRVPPRFLRKYALRPPPNDWMNARKVTRLNPGLHYKFRSERGHSSEREKLHAKGCRLRGGDALRPC